MKFELLPPPGARPYVEQGGMGGGMTPMLPAFGSGGSMRRVFSAGDIQSLSSLNPSAAAAATNPLVPLEDGVAAFRVGRLSVEERRLRIMRYRQKRNERNFNKKIKYVCRKTLADSRPRIRGRFARNDEIEMGQDDDDSSNDEGPEGFGTDTYMMPGVTGAGGGAEYGGGGDGGSSGAGGEDQSDVFAELFDPSQLADLNFDFPPIHAFAPHAQVP